MNKGTAIIGFFLCFLTGMGLMYAVERSKGGLSLSKEPTAAGESSHAGSPLPVSDKDAQWGSPDALVTIVQFSDFQCPFCSRVEPTITQIKQTYKPEQVRLVWKNNPLPFHNHARPAADAAETVFSLKGNDAFWKFHATVFENQKAIDEASFEQWAVAAGVDAAKFNEALKAKTYTAKVDQDMALAQKVGAGGTPSFRINGKVLSGAQPFDKFKEAIDAELAAAAEMVKGGTKPSDVSLALTKKNFEAPKAQGQGAAKPGGAPSDDPNAVNKVMIAADDPVRGPKDAAVTIVMFSDFQCPFCSRVEPTLKQVEDTYKNDVRVVWKDNPLPFHNRAKPAANFARAAYDKGGDKLFWKAHDEIFANQKDIEDTGLQAVAKTIGLDWASAKAAIDGSKYAEKISASINQADALAAGGTPHFFINGRRLVGAKPFDAFKSVIDEELGKAKTLLKNGVAADKIYDEIMKTAKSGGGEPEKRDVVDPTKADPVRGNASAPITIQVFSDFQCPFCSKVEPTLKQLLDEYGSKVRIVWRDMPLPFHQKAPAASEAAYEAFVQKGNDGFWAFHDKLFANQQAIDRPDLEKYAQEAGLDMAKFKDALDSHKHKAHIDANVELAKKAGVSGTPAFTINGYFLSGAQPYEKFDKMVKFAMSK